MVDEPQILAVIVNYNAGEWLHRAVTALLSSRCPLRVRVVDNASQDASLEPLDALAAAGAIAIERNDENLGFGAACNRALADATEPFYLLLNPDCVVGPETVDHLYRAFAEEPKAGIAGGLILGEDGLEQRASRRRAPTPRRALRTFLGLERLGLEGVNVREPLSEAVQEVEAVSGALLFVRAACFQALNGFDEDFFLHCEDLDLFARARAAGWKVLFVPAARARHAQGVSQRGRRLFAERHKHAGMARYYRRHLAADSAAPLRWLYPVLIWTRFALMAPLLAWRQWWESR